MILFILFGIIWGVRVLMVTNYEVFHHAPSLTQIVRQENASSVFWSIYVPAYLNPTGKAGKMYFSTRAEAESKRWELLAATRTESKITELSNPQIRDAQRALERLSEAGLDLSLDKAIELALPTLKAAGRAISVDQLFSDFAAAKANDWSDASKRAFATSAKTFLRRWAGHMVSSIDSDELEAWYEVTFTTSGYRAPRKHSRNDYEYHNYRQHRLEAKSTKRRRTPRPAGEHPKRTLRLRPHRTVSHPRHPHALLPSPRRSRYRIPALGQEFSRHAHFLLVLCLHFC